MLTITVNQRQVDRVLRELAHIRDGAPKAMSAALNKTARGMRTDVVRTLAKVYTAKQKAIRPCVNIGKRASPRDLTASVIGSTKKLIPLIDFRVSPRKVTKKRPKAGLRVTVKRGSGSRIQHGFIAVVGGGHTGLFVRKGAARLPIKQLYGPDVPGMMNVDGNAEKVLGQAAVRLDKEIESQLDRFERG